jgi:molybdenum cofactor biosynthesis protein B
VSDQAPREHKAYAPKTLRCCVLTISDTRTPETDKSGDLIQRGLEEAGYQVVERQIVPDEPERVRREVLKGIARPDLDVVLATGGTGVAPRDSTVEAVEPLLHKQLSGFGELFRSFSVEEIGPAAMLSRALAGTAGRTAIFVMPGSSGAALLATERLILPELGHLVGQLRR